jgi:Actinobacteria/chloroflexi VLRF1 release factor
VQPSSPGQPSNPGPSRRLIRTALVPGPRVVGWVERFSAAHGPLTEELHDGGLVLSAADGAEALLTAPWPEAGRPGIGNGRIERLASLASQQRTLGLVLVRRGGYAVGVAKEGTLLASKSGSRYVQSRSAAGGSSQQRFARRRANQADALALEAAEQAARIFAGHLVEYLVPGGDRPLASQVLAAQSLRAYARCVVLPFLAVPDPNAKVLAQAAADVCAVRVQVTDPPA